MKNILLLLLVLLTACTTPTQRALVGMDDPVPDEVKTMSMEEAYVYAIRMDAPGYNDISDSRLVALGIRMCETFDETGDDFNDVLAYFLEDEYDEDAITLLIASVSFLCPEHLPEEVAV